jgi:hypothetical protein
MTVLHSHNKEIYQIVQSNIVTKKLIIRKHCRYGGTIDHPRWSSKSRAEKVRKLHLN